MTEVWWRTAKEALVVAACLLVCSIIVGFFLIPEMREADRWIGKDAGWLPVLGGLATVATAATAAIFAGLTYRATRQEARDAYRAGRMEAIDTRFQKAAELLGSTNSITTIGGVYALRDIINIDPDRYYLSGLQLLCDFIGDRCRPDYETYASAEVARNAGAAPRYSPRVTPPEVYTAWVQLGTLRTPQRVERYERLARPYAFDIETLLLHGVSFYDLNFEAIRISRLISGQFLAGRCKFDGAQLIIAGCEMGGVHDGNITIIDCSMRAAFIQMPEGPITSRSSMLTCNLCDLDNGYLNRRGLTTISRSSVNGATLEHRAHLVHCWHFGTPPLDMDANSFVFDASGLQPHRISDRGFPIYEPF